MTYAPLSGLDVSRFFANFPLFFKIGGLAGLIVRWWQWPFIKTRPHCTTGTIGALYLLGQTHLQTSHLMPYNAEWNYWFGDDDYVMFQGYDLIMLFRFNQRQFICKQYNWLYTACTAIEDETLGVPSDHLSRKPHREVSLRKALKLNCISFMKLSAKTACRKCTMCLGSRVKKRGSFSVWYMMMQCLCFQWGSGSGVRVMWWGWGWVWTRCIHFWTRCTVLWTSRGQNRSFSACRLVPGAMYRNLINCCASAAVSRKDASKHSHYFISLWRHSQLWEPLWPLWLLGANSQSSFKLIALTN